MKYVSTFCHNAESVDGVMNMNELLFRLALVFIFLCGFHAGLPATAAEFGGFVCDTTCLINKEGYQWARAKKVTRDSQCADPLHVDKKSRPFFEGCIAYLENPSRGSRFDDAGKEIK